MARVRAAQCSACGALAVTASWELDRPEDLSVALKLRVVRLTYGTLGELVEEVVAETALIAAADDGEVDCFLKNAIRIQRYCQV